LNAARKLPVIAGPTSGANEMPVNRAFGSDVDRAVSSLVDRLLTCRATRARIAQHTSEPMRDRAHVNWSRCNEITLLCIASGSPCCASRRRRSRMSARIAGRKVALSKITSVA
jgi:hypothetical protein